MPDNQQVSPPDRILLAAMHAQSVYVNDVLSYALAAAESLDALHADSGLGMLGILVNKLHDEVRARDHKLADSIAETRAIWERREEGGCDAN